MRRVLIVTEGEVTEVEYFEALKSLLKLVSVDLNICGKECDSSPTAVVRYALQRADAEGAHDKGGYNDVYCVFDRDTHADFEKALSQILTANKPKSLFKGETITAVPSYPCFEVWLLMHFVDSRAPFAAANGKTVAQVVEAELKKHSPFENFAKSLTKEMVEALQANTDNAIERAEKVMRDAEKTGELNPSTEVHLLVKALYDLQRK
ncbi:RloB family protein [Paracoccus saliphilus]|nr:RloB family protein [Paracoccus saliphilus]WCR01622.1 RloB domain-containing protein [Paracoccus saliphilus]